ncbi:condensin complex subunit 2 isoform X2 [Agrilus planipennis]|uniref:Condensin complex subunit 2 n=1 Tax=Agrilus planipennis TaxID=224129 RepID=A0A1W4XMA8_AGRPL|nr:condensin complex subunit 2 isoform X2 [Agrilus planipennis]
MTYITDFLVSKEFCNLVKYKTDKKLQRYSYIHKHTAELYCSNMNLNTVTNTSASPLRKFQLSDIQNTIDLLQHDDNAERLQRRSLVGSKVDIPEMSGLIKVGEQQLIQDHFQLCVKMFVENKINTKNVWNLKAIDYMETVLQLQSSNKNFLHIGGTSLDICSKVYGLRVDDLYASGLQLVDSITRSDVKSIEIGHSDEENENHKKKSKKKSKKGRPELKSTVVKDLKSITGNLPKLELNHFQTRLGVDTGNTGLLFTNTLQMHPFNYSFLIVSQVPWVSYSNLFTKPVNDSTRSYIWPLRCTENALVICKAFTNFEINQLNPDESGSCIMHQSFDSIIINEKGLPVAELDGSVHDSFNIKNGIQGLDDVDNPEVQYKIYNEPEHLLTFKPEDHATVCNEYSYACCGSYINNSRNTITQMWAGPSHWKLKYIRPAVRKFSGIEQRQKNGRREKETLSVINFYSCPKLTTVKYKSKKTSCLHNAGRLTIPENHVQKMFTDFGIKLASKPLVIYPRNSRKMLTNLEPDLPFNYKNPNDSEYCCENNLERRSFEVQEGKNPSDEYQNEDCDNVKQAEKNDNFIGENLVSCPQIVQKSFIPYALTSKKLDIRQLKNAVWKFIESEDVKKNVQVAQRQPILFSKIYKKVPNLISKKLKEEVSLPVTFVAFLHLVNEHNLIIEKHINDITDFKIKVK